MKPDKGFPDAETGWLFDPRVIDVENRVEADNEPWPDKYPGFPLTTEQLEVCARNSLKLYLACEYFFFVHGQEEWCSIAFMQRFNMVIKHLGEKEVEDIIESVKEEFAKSVDQASGASGPVRADAHGHTETDWHPFTEGTPEERAAFQAEIDAAYHAAKHEVTEQ